jgi:hypothetical protein
LCFSVISGPACSHQAATATETASSLNISCRITDYERSTKVNRMLGRRLLVQKRVWLLATAHFSEPVWANVWPNYVGSALAKLNRELPKPQLKVFDREQPFRDSALYGDHRTNETSSRHARHCCASVLDWSKVTQAFKEDR